MAAETSFDYYYGDESNQFSFYRIPRQLVTGDRFKRLSTDAKLLHGRHLVYAAPLEAVIGFVPPNGRGVPVVADRGLSGQVLDYRLQLLDLRGLEPLALRRPLGGLFLLAQAALYVLEASAHFEEALLHRGVELGEGFQHLVLIHPLSPPFLAGGRGLPLQPPGGVVPLVLVGADRLAVLLAAPGAELPVEGFVLGGAGDGDGGQESAQGFRRGRELFKVGHPSFAPFVPGLLQRWARFPRFRKLA